MEFSQFRGLQIKHINENLRNAKNLYLADVDTDTLWELYLNSFPEGTNEIFRERREYDCSCCKHYVRSFGNVVFIVDYEPVTIWDFATNDDTFQPVVNALSTFVKQSKVKDVLVTKESVFGTDESYDLSNETVFTWSHFYTKLPKSFVTQSSETAPTLTGQFRDVKNVFQRSLEEITETAIVDILDLIAEKALYRGEEWQSTLEKFLKLHRNYHNLDDNKKDNFCWVESVNAGPVIGKIRNHVIGVLLVNLSEGMDFVEAINKYDAMFENYKRPKPIFSKQMVKEAEEFVDKNGLRDSLSRRHAQIADITINNVLWANRDVQPFMNGSDNVFDLLKKDVSSKPTNFDNVPSVDIEEFMSDTLPTATSIEILFENNFVSNLVSLIAPQNKKSKSMFKWDNNFSWAYNGNITDSMKERVREFGGKVDGDLRVSLQWEHNDDLDLHCIEPHGNEIFFSTKGREHTSSGMLDVDIIDPRSDSRVKDGIAVENITYSDKNYMYEGIYTFFIHNYSNRGGNTGFQAELEYNGQIYQYNHAPSLGQGQKVVVVKFNFSRKSGIKIIESLPSTSATKTIWSLNTNEFHPVTTVMYSPNYWDEQTGNGNRHYMFMLSGCKTEDRLNGFFNEFLDNDLMKHKRVFEALGSKMRVEVTDNQMSGVGFSSTKRNSFICRVDNKRIIKVVV